MAALLASAAAAEPTAPQPPEELETGGLLEVGVADTSSFTPAVQSQNFSGLNGQLPVLVTTLRGGAWIASHSELSVGLSFSFLSTDSGGNGQTFFDLVVAPTYRYHFTALKPWSLSPFASVSLLFGISNVSFTGGSQSTTTPQYGAQAGVGAEYLFGDRFGVVIDAGVRFVNFTFGASGGFGGTTVNAFQLWGSAAVALHF